MQIASGRKKGFTLIELLIVIAIIAILAAIIMSALSQARNQGADGGVKQNLVNARSQAALYYATTSNYTNLCTNATIRRFVQAAAQTVGLTPQSGAYVNSDVGAWNEEACHSDATRYVIWVPLKDSAVGTSVGWCVDSTNASKRVSVAGATGIAGGGTPSFVCP